MAIRRININQFVNFTKKFPEHMEKAGFSINKELAKSYQRRIKSRATGRLKKIEVVPRGKKLIEIKYPNKETAKVAEIVNAGRFPKHKIPAQLMDASRAGKETVGRSARSVVGELPNPRFVSPKASASKGFLTKSMVTLQRDTPKIMEKKLQETFNAI